MNKRGETESSCLKDVKQCLFRKSWLDGFLFDEVSDEHFMKQKYCYLSEVSRHCFHGLDDMDILLIRNMIKSAHPNRKLSEFPDFICDMGFIEHFQVTASHVTRKGSPYSIQTSKLEQNIENWEHEVVKESCPNCFYEMPSTMIPAPEGSYENLVTSFQANWKNHIESLRNYAGNKNCGIFMIDMRHENLLSMCEMYPPKDVEGDVRYGDVVYTAKRVHGYRLSFDKAMLNWIYQYRDLIHYVIFVGPFLEEKGKDFGVNSILGSDVISTKRIPSIIALQPNDYNIYPHVTLRTPYACHGVF